MHQKTRQAIEALRPNPPQAHDEQTMAMIRESAKKLYGWDWPPEMGLQEGARKLFDHLMIERNRQRGER